MKILNDLHAEVATANSLTFANVSYSQMGPNSIYRVGDTVYVSSITPGSQVQFTLTPASEACVTTIVLDADPSTYAGPIEITMSSPSTTAVAGSTIWSEQLLILKGDGFNDWTQANIDMNGATYTINAFNGVADFGISGGILTAGVANLVPATLETVVFRYFGRLSGAPTLVAAFLVGV